MTQKESREIYEKIRYNGVYTANNDSDESITFLRFYTDTFVIYFTLSNKIGDISFTKEYFKGFLDRVDIEYDFNRITGWFRFVKDGSIYIELYSYGIPFKEGALFMKLRGNVSNDSLSLLTQDGQIYGKKLFVFHPFD